MVNLNQKRFSKTITSKIRPSDRFDGSSASWKKIARAILLTLCFSLFNNQLVVAQDPHESGGNGPNGIIPIQAGEALPESMWETPMNVARHPQGESQGKPQRFQGKETDHHGIFGNMDLPVRGHDTQKLSVAQKNRKGSGSDHAHRPAQGPCVAFSGSGRTARLAAPARMEYLGNQDFHKFLNRLHCRWQRSYKRGIQKGLFLEMSIRRK